MFRITPQSTSFYGLFDTSAGQVLEAAQLLRDAVGMSPDERAEASDRMGVLERESGSGTREIVQVLRASFVTPFDRGDVHLLAVRLDQCLDALDAALDVLVLHQIAELPDDVAEQVDTIVLLAELTVSAMTGLRKVGLLDTYWTEVARLTDIATRSHRLVVAELLASKRKAGEVIRVGSFSAELATVARAFAEVALTVEGIAVKES